ncbi:MAG: LytTR family DNA-binding domain-containing protein [Parasphingorhabdus sp.]|uniref:LytR/AlgR family response regulator transcription factor n=1 Tax=Parasphingorhabdus sp. TaxID=2709688 RepID=UPI00300155AC
MKLNILIVDDEPLARSRIESLCSRMDNVGQINSASGGREALDCIAQNCPEIVFLDIDMPDISGMKVAEQCKQFEKAPEVIFTTAHSRYAVEAFRLNAIDYLLKPVKERQLKEAFEKVAQKRWVAPIELQPTADHRLWVQDGNGAVQIRCADISAIVADRDYMRIYLLKHSYLVHEPMQSLLDRLPAGMFIRIHRSAAVRVDFVRNVQRKGRRKFIALKDDTEFTIGRTFTKAVINRLAR